MQTAAVDPNGLVTRWAHDGFGRVTREVRPDETETTFTLTRTKDGGVIGDGWNVKLETHVEGGQRETVHYDSLGRPVRFWKERPQVGSSAAERVMQRVVFDHLGERVAARSVPDEESTPDTELK